MSELKKKILEGIDLNGLQRYARREVQPYYDNWKEYGELTDEDIDELATDILNEISDQPTLNENQQEMLEWLQAYGDIDSGDKPFQTIFYISECFRTGRLDYSVLANLSKLNRKQQAQVLQVFSQWVLEQEAE